jgi:predicted nucleotidyltransferase
MKIDRILTINDTLEPQIWQNNQLVESIKQNLVAIAVDFFDQLGFGENFEGHIEDITFTGSVANFNWTKHSDIDLHLIVDFAKIDENYDLVREYFSAKTSSWNKMHEIKIFGYEVEIYVQDSNETHISSGIYSIMDNEWLVEPEKEVPEVDASMVMRKVNSFSDMVERVEDFYDDKNYQDAHTFSIKLAKKIKKFRQSGLEERGEYSFENLAFKYLRNNGIIKSLFDVRNRSYDKMMSLDGSYMKKFKIFIDNDALEEKTGFYRLDEIEKFQKKVKRRHSRMKRRLIGFGKQKTGPAYPKKPSYRRSKSAPPGFGGA